MRFVGLVAIIAGMLVLGGNDGNLNVHQNNISVVDI